MGVQKEHEPSTSVLLWVTYQQAHVHLTRHDEVDNHPFLINCCKITFNGSQLAKNEKVHSSHVTALKFIGKKRLV